MYVTHRCRTQFNANKVQENGWRTMSASRPTNLGLFLELNETIQQVEARGCVLFAFWHVPREYNKVADKLAKKGVKLVEEINKRFRINVRGPFYADI